MVNPRKKILIVGGGAAGYFAALNAAERNPTLDITIVESGSKPLQKLAISGGGRCNVTQGCFDPKRLIEAYPRGAKELRGPFSKFQPEHTIDWFESRGVKLKTEADGRVFPVTDLSSTVIDCFEKTRKEHSVQLQLKTKLIALESSTLEAKLRCRGEVRVETYDAVLLACGGSKSGYEIAGSCGHTIEEIVPSLFTFEVDDPRLAGLPGVSVSDAELTLKVGGRKSFLENGPLLVTHWGFSGPAVIRLSAWAARELHQAKYQAELVINWLGKQGVDDFARALLVAREEQAKKIVSRAPLLNVPKRLWEAFCRAAGVGELIRFSELSGQMAACLEAELFRASYRVSGKGVFKEEFVTCGGVSLREVDFRTMESKIVPGLYFAGEILDIDGITGGYNFQSAWTSGYLAACAIAESV